MSQFTRHLKSLNRKERYWLLKWAIGSDFQLTSEFRQAVGKQIGVDIPKDAYVAMDYHLNWIYAAISFSSGQSTGGPFKNPRFVNSRGEEAQIVQGNQEDVDLLVSFVDRGTDHLVMVEAKAYSPWLDNQLSSKAKRLDAIFSRELNPNVKPHFVVASPNPITLPDHSDSSRWPTWMAGASGELHWVRLPVSDEPLQKVVRCDKGGNDSATGDYWQLKEDSPHS